MKEIKASDLRIGNLVDFLGGILEIETISIESDLSDIKPIPLTEEWLEMFGFRKNDEGRYDNRMELSLVDNCYHFRQGWTNVKIEYVHALQNLFYALCGEELTINN